MANIQEILTKILSSKYGKDMRQAIHDGIQQCYDDATEDSTAIDSTLSNSGEAADAKATGDALKNKLDTNQGSGNKGKAMVVGGDGTLIPEDIKVPVDNTLKNEGEAADAKVTGQKITNISSAVSSLKETVGNHVSLIPATSMSDMVDESKIYLLNGYMYYYGNDGWECGTTYNVILPQNQISINQYGSALTVGNALNENAFMKSDENTLVWGGII